MNTLSIQKDNSQNARGVLLIRSFSRELSMPKAFQRVPQETIRSMDEELRFWKIETCMLLKTLQQLELRNPGKNVKLEALKQESAFLLEHIFSAHETKLKNFRKKMILGKNRIRMLERSHRKIRHGYHRFRLKSLWVLPSLTPIVIW